MRTGKTWSRRRFLTGIAALGTAGRGATSAAAEPPPETTAIRLIHGPSMCHSPQYIAEALLRAEGFAHVSCAKAERSAVIEKALASGEADINLHFAAPLILRLEAGDPILILAGDTSVALSCLERTGSGPSAI